MTTNENKRMAMTILGTAFLLCLFAAAPMIEMASNPGFTDTTVNTNQVSPQGFIRAGVNAMGISAGGWYAKYVIDANGFGYCVWVGQEGSIYSNTTHISNMSGVLSGVNTFLAFNVSINYRKTKSPIYETGKWNDWNTTTISVKNVTQRGSLGFMDAAIDGNGDLNVFYSNDQITNSSSVYDRFTATLWNTDSGNASNSPLSAKNLTAIDNTKQTWKYLLNDLDSAAGSISVRGPAGQILFDSNTRHLLWNNGYGVFHKLNNSANTTVVSDTFVGECSMVLASNGNLIIAYARGATNLGKQIYTKTLPKGGALSGETLQSTATPWECVMPNVFLDSNDAVHLVWSAQVDAATATGFRYVVQYKTGSTTQNVSKDYGLVSVETPIYPLAAFAPRGVFYKGQLNIFYLDNTDFTSEGGDFGAFHTNLVWQDYGGAAWSTANTFRVISSTAAFEEYTFTIAKTTVDDIIVAYYSQSSGPSEVNLAKIDTFNPVITVTSPLSMDKPEKYDLTFRLSEADLTFTVNWRGAIQTATFNSGTGEWVVTITADKIATGRQSYSIVAIDEVGNQAVEGGEVTFNDPYVVLIVVIVAICAVVVVLVVVYYMKNKTKFMKKKLELKMGGKPAEDTTWGDEGPAEDEGSGGEEGSVDLKKDLKKVDM